MIATLAARVSLVAGGSPLTPSPDDARSQLRRELVDPDYHRSDPVQAVLDGVQRLIDGVSRAGGTQRPVVLVASLLLFALLVLGLGWLLSRARRTARRPGSDTPVLHDVSLTAAQLRARADAALAEGRFDDAVVDGFRALAVREAEAGRLVDARSATTREVATRLRERHLRLDAQVTAAATTFDLVLYGHHAASARQARDVLALDDTLVGAR
ncbi:DUF4129 domain-containing protein [Nocardioides acrostichi]|uniref:DUF4129 domain-containing protein n=1 Tax=Nocardioides acrostichi TaxID=2784339 RepID=A0A930V385_9ACTN|nr:DUF4129 domain-containing protein [Nocardioides acrostichi]MBF4162992.1 DUF4129 domain-containing protein [Nocardioides acrostichi]